MLVTFSSTSVTLKFNQEMKYNISVILNIRQRSKNDIKDQNSYFFIPITL